MTSKKSKAEDDTKKRILVNYVFFEFFRIILLRYKAIMVNAVSVVTVFIFLTNVAESFTAAHITLAAVAVFNAFRRIGYNIVPFKIGNGKTFSVFNIGRNLIIFFIERNFIK